MKNRVDALDWLMNKVSCIIDLQWTLTKHLARQTDIYNYRVPSLLYKKLLVIEVEVIILYYAVPCLLYFITLTLLSG